MAVGFVASATSGSQASVASFNIGTLGTGARAGIVFVCTHGTGDLITGVTWNGVAMSKLFRAADTDTEPGSVVAYFLDNVTNGTITVSRTNNAVVTVGYAASLSALRVCRAYQTITRAVSTQNTDADTSSTGTGASGEVTVDDGSPGTSSMRFAAAYTGAATPVAAGTNSTSLQSLDSTAFGSSFVRETTAGQGSRSVGFATGTTDDWALVAVAVREEPALNPQPSAASLTTSLSTPAVALPIQVTPGSVSLTTTPATPTVTATQNQNAQPSAASLTLTASVPAIVNPVGVTPGASSLTLTAATPAIALPIAAAPSAASLTITPDTPAIALPVGVAPSASSLSLSPDTPAIVLPVGVTPSAATLALAADAPDIGMTIVAVPDAAALTLATSTPDVSVTAGVTLFPSAASLAMTAFAPDMVITDHKQASPTPVALTVTGAVPSVLTPSVFLPIAASLALAGSTPSITNAPLAPLLRSTVSATLTVPRHSSAAISVPSPPSAEID